MSQPLGGKRTRFHAVPRMSLSRRATAASLVRSSLSPSQAGLQSAVSTDKSWAKEFALSAAAGFAELDPRWRNRFRGSRLLFLPGGRWQVPVIRVVQQMGLVVICA